MEGFLIAGVAEPGPGGRCAGRRIGRAQHPQLCVAKCPRAVAGAAVRAVGLDHQRGGESVVHPPQVPTTPPAPTSSSAPRRRHCARCASGASRTPAARPGRRAAAASPPSPLPSAGRGPCRALKTLDGMIKRISLSPRPKQFQQRRGLEGVRRITGVARAAPQPRDCVNHAMARRETDSGSAGSKRRSRSSGAPAVLQRDRELRSHHSRRSERAHVIQQTPRLHRKPDDEKDRQ